MLNLIIADNGTGDELREQADIEREVKGVFLHGRISAVNVNNIGERLKREERDAEREGNAAYGEQTAPRQRVDGIDSEVEILEHKEDAQIDDYSRN